MPSGLTLIPLSAHRGLNDRASGIGPRTFGTIVQIIVLHMRQRMTEDDPANT